MNLTIADICLNSATMIADNARLALKGASKTCTSEQSQKAVL